MKRYQMKTIKSQLLLKHQSKQMHLNLNRNTGHTAEALCAQWVGNAVAVHGISLSTHII